jgi:hypothetical protein
MATTPESFVDALNSAFGKQTTQRSAHAKGVVLLGKFVPSTEAALSITPRRRHTERCLTTRQYSRLVSAWIAGIDLDPALYGTHSLRRTKATLIYRRTGNLRAVFVRSSPDRLCPASDYLPFGSVEPICRTSVRNVRDIAVLIAARFLRGQTSWSERVRARAALGSSNRIDPTTSFSEPVTARTMSLPPGR